jgi:transposase
VKALLADRGYDANAIRKKIAFHGNQAVIPAKRGRRNPATHDRDKYRLRSRIEQLFNKLRNRRRIAKRYDKTRTSFFGFISLASALLWLRLCPRSLVPENE